jgi:hypothetical protein
MNTLETMISIVLLIYVLSVIVQAIQEVVKAMLGTKAEVMKLIIMQFMGEHLRLDQVMGALAARGLKIADLENFNVEAFRQLLDGIKFDDQQLKGLVDKAQATSEEIKAHIASSYEAARVAFQTAYTKRIKIFVLVTSFIVVIVLNANIISLYDQISADSVVQQTLAAQVQNIELPKSPTGDLQSVYKNSREQISSVLEQYPILMRSAEYKQDFTHPFKAVLGLLVMGILVSLGAPFWNDALKSLAAANNTLGTKRT